MTDRIDIRVYYEDTDLAGIVYYANYLKFIERGRSEYVRARGIDQTALKREMGLVFAVRRLEADYLVAARFDDLVTVETELVRAGGAKVVMVQRVLKGETLCFEAVVTLAVLGPEGRAARLPADVRRALG